MRCLFYSHDSMGLGSARRQIAVAVALHRIAPRAKMLLATSIDELGLFDLPPNLPILKLPGIQKRWNGEYYNSRLKISGSKLQNLRSTLLLETMQRFSPTVMIVDKHPFGVGGELADVLEKAKSSGTRLVFGMRDILDDAKTVLHEWSPSHAQERIAESYDLVLIYGKPSIYNPVDQYQFPRSLIKRIKYCGYVVNQPLVQQPLEEDSCLALPKHDERPVVLSTTGGGKDGFMLLKTFIKAAGEAPWHGVAVTGPLLPQREQKVLQKLAAKNGVKLKPFIPCLSNLFSKTSALVCMGGYNTLSEALSQGLPTVSVPRVKPRSEQLIRATAFDGLGLLRMIEPHELNAETLATKINEAIKSSRQTVRQRATALLAFDGAQQAAHHILALNGRALV